MSAPPCAVTVKPEAALELVGLLARQLRLLISESAQGAPNLVYQLAGGLELTASRGIDAEQVERLRWFAWAGRRLDMAEAFDHLNPGFAVKVHVGYLAADYAADEVRQQAAVQRRELELSMGERFARMLAPAQGGGAA
jgi:hypothetical protein